MQIFTELNKNPNLSIALGYFDGVHSGHRTVIQNAVAYAKKNGGKSAVITFTDHPCCFFYGICPKYILTRQERENRIKAIGVDYLYELDFESISGLTAAEYLKDVLVKYFSPCAISTGWNHNFGYKKSGNAKFLHDSSKKFGYEYFELPPKKINNEIVSSSAIRKYLSEGKLEKANTMLGYKFYTSGRIIKGQQLGRTIGYKTANMIYPAELISLPFGVYSVQTNFGKGIANFGTRPTVKGEGTLLEVHILDFDKDIYGETLNVEFNKMIRPEKKFPSLDALKNQIRNDIKQV